MNGDDMVGLSSDYLGFAAPVPESPGRVVLIWATGAQLTGARRSVQRLEMTDAACDLSALTSGRAPLLVDHDRSIGGLVGIVEQAWLQDGQGFAVARFSRGARAQEISRDVADLIITNCSISFHVGAAELDEGATEELPRYKITRWTPFEISLVALGNDAMARVSTVSPVTIEQVAREAAERTARIDRNRRRALLQPARWHAWASEVADQLSHELGVAPGLAFATINARVEAQLDALVDG